MGCSFDKFREPKNLKAVLTRVYGSAEYIDDELIDSIHTPSSETLLWLPAS